MVDVTVVAIPCDRGTAGGHPGHQVMDKYVAPVVEVVGALPWLVPARADVDVEALVDRVDGVMLTGGWSNIEPHRYGGGESYEGCLHDPDRDDLALRLVRAALTHGVPLLGICRGLQELNVALGGTLHQRIWELPRATAHRDAEHHDEPDPYQPRHTVDVTGELARIVGAERIEVNSLHGQAVDDVADGLVVEGVATDGLVEAVRVQRAPAFALAVQWHPEWRFAETPHHAAVFEAFGRAVAAHTGSDR